MKRTLFIFSREDEAWSLPPPPGTHASICQWPDGEVTVSAGNFDDVCDTLDQAVDLFRDEDSRFIFEDRRLEWQNGPAMHDETAIVPEGKYTIRTSSWNSDGAVFWSLFGHITESRRFQGVRCHDALKKFCQDHYLNLKNSQE